MKYKLLKDWDSKGHGKTIKAGVYVIITIEKELEYLIENELIDKPKKTKKKKKKVEIETEIINNKN